MKRLQALIAATLVTGMVAVAMLLIGVNALLNTNGVRPSNSPTAQMVSAAGSTATDPSQVAQLQNEVTQYQQQLVQANQQLQQYQQVLVGLQQMGVIRVGNDGTIQVRARGFGGDGD